MSLLYKVSWADKMMLEGERRGIRDLLFDDLEERFGPVPEEIRSAFQTMAKAYAKYAVALRGIDLKAGQVPDAATIAKLAKAAQSLNNQDLTKASTEISAWVTKNCSATP